PGLRPDASVGANRRRRARAAEPPGGDHHPLTGGFTEDCLLGRRKAPLSLSVTRSGRALAGSGIVAEQTQGEKTRAIATIPARPGSSLPPLARPGVEQRTGRLQRCMRTGRAV